MAPHTFFLSALTLLLFLTLQSKAATPSALAPGPAGPINITAILEDASQFTTFIRLLTDNEISNQINDHINTSTDGMTVFAPTDNAFANLPAGTINKLTDRQQIQLIQYHILPKYYDLASLLTVSNPVRTLLSGQDDGVYGLNFTGQATQVNVSTGIVDTLINNPSRQKKPLAVYQVDKVLLPAEFYEAKPPAASPPAKSKGKGEVEAAPAPKPTKEKPADDSSEFYEAKPPVASSPAKSKGKGEVEAAPAPKPNKEKPADDSSEFYEAKPPAASPPAKSKGKGEVEAAPAPKPTKEKPADDSSESGRMNVGFGLVACVWLFCMGMLS